MTDTLGFNLLQPEEFARQTFKALEETQRARKDFLELSKETVERANLVNQQFSGTLDVLSERQDQTFQQGEKAYQNLNEIAALPEVIANLIGLFDSDYNRDVQLNRLAQSNFDLSRLDVHLNRAKQRRALTLEELDRRLKEKAAFVTELEAGRVAATDTVKAFFDVQESASKADLVKVGALTDKQLVQYVTDPDSVPPDLRHVQGFIQVERLQREMNKAQLDVTETNLAQAQRAIVVSDYLKSFGSFEEMEKTFEAARTGKKTLPKGVLLGDLRDEITRLKNIDADMASSVALAASHKFEQAAKRRNDALTRMTPEALVDLEAFALQRGGKITIGSPMNPDLQMEVTVQDIRAAIPIASKIKTEAAQSQAQLAQDVANVQLLVQQNNEVMGMIAGVHSLSAATVNPTTGQVIIDDRALPTEVRLQKDAVQRTINNKMIAANAEAQSEVLKTQKAYLDGYLEKQMKDFYGNDKDLQAATNRWIAGRGVFNEPAPAATVLSKSNQANLMQDNPVLGLVYGDFVTAFNAISKDQRFTFRALPGGIETSKGEVENIQAVQEAIEKSDARNKFQGLATQQVLRLASMGLWMQEVKRKQQRVDPQQLPGIPEKLIWSAVIDPNTNNWTPRFFDPETGQWDFRRFEIEMAKITAELHEKNILQPNQSVLDLVIDTAQMMVANGVVDRMFPNTPEGAAFKFAAFNNRPSSLVSSNLSKMQRAAPSVMQRAQDLEKDLSRIESQIMDIRQRRAAQDPTKRGSVQP